MAYTSNVQKQGEVKVGERRYIWGFAYLHQRSPTFSNFHLDESRRTLVKLGEQHGLMEVSEIE